MENEDLLYIEDDDQRKLFYRFTPASLISNFVPLIVILDDERSDILEGVEYKMWNILTPLVHLEKDESTSCWLGEKGDFYLKDLLQELIREISEAYECEDHIYLYGRSIGGYGAILHGIICKANALYAYAPQIRLQETNTTDIAIDEKENDLTNFLNARDTFPVFYLCDDAISMGNPPEDETAYFANSCRIYGINVHLDFCAKDENDERQHLKTVLDFFERVASEG